MEAMVTRQQCQLPQLLWQPLPTATTSQPLLRDIVCNEMLRKNGKKKNEKKLFFLLIKTLYSRVCCNVQIRPMASGQKTFENKKENEKRKKRKNEKTNKTKMEFWSSPILFKLFSSSGSHQVFSSSLKIELKMWNKRKKKERNRNTFSPFCRIKEKKPNSI